MRSPELPAHELLLQLYRAALGAADPLQVIPPHLPPPPQGRTVVVGVGKAAAAMAEAVEAHWQGPLQGVVVVPEGATRPLRHIEVLTGSHPVPDASSVRGGDALLQAVSGLQPDDLVIALVSGGGSALCAKPADGLTLEEKQSVTRELLLRGASISEINTVRRHLSAIKGGRLAAAAHPARVVTLLISDIPGDEPTLIASGPTLADASTCADALAVLERYGITHIPAVLEALQARRWESVKPGDARLAGNRHVVVASAWDGEARDLAKAHAALALSVAQRGVPFQAPCVLVSGGEATVTVRGKGRGGRNTEFALALALALKDQKEAHRIHGISAGTDGLDGKAEAAGAWVDAHTLARGAQQGLSALQCLDANDSATFLDAAGTLVHTGPTFTNINDFRAVLVL
jgi:hydroxypyruvate reductase